MHTCRSDLWVIFTPSRKQDYVGQVTHVHWESSSPSGSGSGRKLFIATERNLVASLNIHDGSIGKCMRVPVLHMFVLSLCILSDLVKLLLCDCE